MKEEAKSSTSASNPNLKQGNIVEVIVLYSASAEQSILRSIQVKSDALVKALIPRWPAWNDIMGEASSQPANKTERLLCGTQT